MKQIIIFIAFWTTVLNCYGQSNDSLGLSSNYPIKVGAGVFGGFANMETYLNNLIDIEGRQIKYRNLGFCCNYKTENGPSGIGYLGRYMIDFFEDDSLVDTVQLFLTFFDYEKPTKAPRGFKFDTDSISELLEINEANVLKKYSGEKSVSMSFLQLNEVPNYLFNLLEMEELSLAFNNIESIPYEIKTLSKLKKLYIESNKIKELPIEISYLENLQEIWLDYDMNWEQVFNVLSKCKNLKTINLNKANFRKIPVSIIQCQNIENLDFSENPNLNYENAFKTLGQLKNLKEITISLEKKDFPKGISKLAKLKVLNIGYSNVKTLSDEIAHLPDLEELHIRLNRDLTNLPSNIGLAKKLRKVSLFAHGDFFDYDNALQNLSSLDLEYLDLSETRKLKIIPPPVFEFKNLKYLGLNIYETDTIPKEIGQLENLEEIVLASTNLKYLPEEFGNLKSLKKIDLSGRIDFDFEQIFNVFTKLESLEEIDLAWSNQRLPDSIKDLKSIKRIRFKPYINRNWMTEEEIARIKLLLPDCEFIYE